MIQSYPAYYIVPQWNITAFFAPHSYLLSAQLLFFLAVCPLLSESTQSSSSSVTVLWAVKFAKPQPSE